MATPKYRLAFSEDSIRFISTLLADASPEQKATTAYLDVYKTIGTYLIKLDTSTAAPAFVTSNIRKSKQEDLMTSLGSEPTEPSKEDIASKREALYARYLSAPEFLSEREILDAIEYKEIALKEPLTLEEQQIIDNSWGMGVTS